MGITTVFVTHDQEEALELADRIAITNQGRIEQIGTPEEVYEHPVSPFVYNFLGNVNLFHGRVQDGRLRVGDAAVGEADAAGSDAQRGIAYVRPHDVEVAREGDADTIPARVDHVSFAGPFVHVQLTRADTDESLEAALTRDRHRELALKPGEPVHLRFRNARVFAEDYSI